MDHLVQDFAIDPGLRANLVITPDQARNSPANHVDFFSFPGTKGWYISDDHIPETKSQSNSNGTSLASFLQQWLFFGLIFTVAQENGKPLVTADELIQSRQVSTEHLRTKLAAWVQWERSHPHGISFRMLRADLVLEQARRVVRAVCGVNHDADKLVEYENDRANAEHINYMTDEVALSLMTVGEILSAVKHQIMEGNRRAHLFGWHGDDDSGWGPPLYVFKKMETARWCKRTVHLLKGQLGANATLLLAAWTTWRDCAHLIARGHEKCTSEQCTFFPGNEGVYSPQHWEDCPDANPQAGCKKSPGACSMEGPSVEKVCKILDDGGIPLIRMDFDEGKKFQSLSVEEWHKDIDFTCISHVWSHGYGNEEDNKVAKCQLEFIYRQVRKFRDVAEAPSINIWMDTLVIPVGKDHTKQRKIAMMQIERVFEAAPRTLVLDRHLISMERGDDSKPAQAAMRILASGWMRRLWTLQEAFLSRQLMIPFKEGEPNAHNVAELDGLSDQFHVSIQREGISSALLATVKNQLLHNIMGQDRYSRNQSRMDHVNPRQPRRHGKSGALLISNVWRAARFRVSLDPVPLRLFKPLHAYFSSKDVGKPEIEARALATLLGLDYSGTDIEEAGIDSDKDKPPTLDKLMMDFWTQVDEQLRAIPPGIVFLPGEKIQAKGFGWAPSTWLNADEIEYPDPLRDVHAITKLHARYGLLVQYPGFRLHSQDRDSILRIATSQHLADQKLYFPVDRHLQEWYKVTPAEDAAPEHILQIKAETTQLAIILSRPRPQDSIPEIGLLVETWQILPDPTHDEMKTIYCAYVIQRVWVSRHSRARYNVEGGTEQTNHTPSIDNTPQESGLRVAEFLRLMEAECIGEVVPPDQSWYVDRRRFPGQHPPGKKKANGNMSAPGPQAFQPAARSLLRRITGLVPSL